MTSDRPIGHHTYGSGATRVLVFHGWFGDSRVFDPVLPAIDGARFTYAFVDQRGYGASMELGGPRTIEQVAEDGLALADALGWQGFHVVGHSMGGVVAQKLAARASSRVKSLVALSAVPASGVPLDEAGHALFYGAAERDDNCRGILDFTTGGRLSGAWLDFMVQRTRATCRREAFAAYLPSWQKADFASEVDGLELPLLALVGEHDPALSADVMRATLLRWFKDARLDTIANAGHYAMQETPIDLASRLERFFSEVEA